MVWLITLHVTCWLRYQQLSVLNWNLVTSVWRKSSNIKTKNVQQSASSNRARILRLARRFEEVHQQVVGSQKYSGTTTSHPSETSMQILAATQEKSFNHKGLYEKDCTSDVHPQNHLHGHAERVGGCTLSDDVNFRGATVLRDYAGRFRPGNWIFVGPSSEKAWQFDMWDKTGNPKGNWERKALQMKETSHRILPPCHPSDDELRAM